MKNFNFRSLLVPVAILAVSALLFGAGFMSRGLYDTKQERDASKVASQFVDSLLAGDAEKAYSLMSPEYQSAMSKDLFVQSSGNLKTDKPDKKEAITTEAGDTIVYYQQVEGLNKETAGKESANFSITVAKVDGKQRVVDATLQ